MGAKITMIRLIRKVCLVDGYDPSASLSDVLKRLPTQKMSQIEELLPHRCKPEPN